jgi:nitrous oxidase accessory protein NosD
MPSSYPGSLDPLPLPDFTKAMGTPARPQSAVITDLVDAVKALQAAAGTTGAERYAGVLTASAGDQTTAINAFLAAAAPSGLKRLAGNFTVAGTLTPPSGVTVDASAATIMQTASLTPLFTLTDKANVVIKGLRATGKTTDYANNSSVYGAAGVLVNGASADVTVEDCAFSGFAGAGVRIEGTAARVRVHNCRLVGPGAAYILNTTYNYGAGVLAMSPGRWSVTGCDISEWAQGVVTGEGMADVHVCDNRIFDIRGQHGGYIESVDRLVFSDNIIRNCGLMGMKVQIATTGSADPQDITISNNVIDTTGAGGVLLTNIPGGSPRLRRVNVTDNVITATPRGIEANNTVGLHIADNGIYNSTSQGIALTSCSQFSIADNRIQGTADEGLKLNACTDGEVTALRIIDPASGNNTGTEWGVGIVGACSDLTFTNLRITDAAGNMRYGLYSNPTSGQDTFSFRDIYVRGTPEYGIRFQALSAVREWRDIDALGTLGEVLNLPTSGGGMRGSDTFAAAAPTTGTWLVGDRVWHITPVAGGTMGWVCTTAGSPGTWKSFGAIAA